MFVLLMVNGLCGTAFAGEADALKDSVRAPDQLGRLLLKSNYSGITQEYDVFYKDGPTSKTTYGGWHPGIDYRARSPLPVHSPINGMVDSLDQKGKGSGRVSVQIDGTNDYFIFLHLSEPTVKLGQKISVGDLIGISGNTGIGDPHLHVEVRKGQPLPAYYFRSKGAIGINKDPAQIAGNMPAAKPSGPVIGTIKSEAPLGYGCGCTFTSAKENKQPVFVSIDTGVSGQKAMMHIDGRDVVLLHVKGDSPEPGKKSRQIYSGGGTHVQLDYLSAKFCESNECEITEYQLSITVKTKIGETTLLASGDCGC
jgi:hypothetical protein